MQKIKTNILLILLTIFSLQVYAQEFPEKSNHIVSDYTNFLSVNEKNALEQKLVNFSNQTSTQIAIAIIPSLHGYDASSYAFELGERWGVGQKGKNNGILILVKPKTSDSKGEVFIATGYGTEGAVPDAIAKRIVENEILPNFKQGQYYKGLDQAVNTIISLTKGEYTADDYREQTSGNIGSAIPMIIIFMLIIIFSIIGRVRRARHYAVGHNLPFWIALGMLGSSGRSHSGTFGNFTSGSGSFGGFSGGGGFGGFGGGSFGGGGAGG
ncbi:MAG TPA: TPM domain-containing protein, partial [Bacteroidales bacterium]|nr:TPM domain-containing protein [Bacteroidales bacterium]